MVKIARMTEKQDETIFLPKKYKITLENGEVLKLKGRYSKRAVKYTPQKGMFLYPNKEEVILENKIGYKFKLKIDS